MFSHGCVHQASTCDNCKLNELSMNLKLSSALQKQVNQNNSEKFDSIEKILYTLLDIIQHAHELIINKMCESLSESLEKNSNENTTEPLCSSAFNNDKKKEFSFEEAFKYFENGKGISRKGTSGIHYKKYYSESDPGQNIFSLNDIRSKKWIIID